MTLVKEEPGAERAVRRTVSHLSAPTTNSTNQGAPRPVSEEGRFTYYASPEAEDRTPFALPRVAEKFCCPKDGEQVIDGTGKELHDFSRTAISSDLARKLKENAAFLSMRLYSNTLEQTLRAHGAAAILEFQEHGQTHKVLVTAKHNVCKDSVNEKRPVRSS